MTNATDKVNYRKPALIIFGLSFGVPLAIVLAASVHFRIVSSSMVDELSFVAPLQVQSTSWDYHGYELTVARADGVTESDVLTQVEDQLTSAGFAHSGIGDFRRDRDDDFDADVVTVESSNDDAVYLSVSLWDTDMVPCLPG